MSEVLGEVCWNTAYTTDLDTESISAEMATL